jgi:hypothetical protein
MKYHNKAQAWGMDIIIAIMIFSVGILLFLIYTVNNSTESKEALDELSYDGENIFENIFTEGSPNDWNNVNVVRIGIMDDDKINETKLDRFYNLALSDYSRTKSIFNTRFDYYFYFNNISISIGEINGIGKPGTNISDIQDNAKNLIRITRFTSFKEKPVTVFLYIWEE